MSDKKIEISRKKRKNMFIFFSFIILFLIVLSAILYYILDEKTIGLVLFVIGTVGPIVSLFVPDINSKWVVRWKLWSNPNLKWYIRVIVLIDIVSIVFLIFKIIPTQGDKPGTTLQQELYNDSIEAVELQRRFNDLDKEFDNRMKQKLTFENAYELIRGDSCILYEILGMINDNPEIETKPREEYTERFRNRATEAIRVIEKAINSYPDSEKMCEEYGPKINQLKQMLNSL